MAAASKVPATITIQPIHESHYTANTTSKNAFVRLTGSNELVFIELQGSVNRLDSSEQKLGRLEQTEDGRIYLIVGYQKLEGKVVELKKPFAVLRRIQSRNVQNGQRGDEEMHDTGASQAPSGPIEMKVVDICRKKIYFGTRPEPLNNMVD